MNPLLDLQILGWLLVGLGVLVFAATALVVSTANVDLTTSITAALTAIGNVGPGFGAVGPTENFAGLPGYVKLWLGVAMLAGRLEIFTVLVLVSRAFWVR